MHRVGIPRQSSGGYPAFGLKNPFRTRGDYQVYFQIGHGGQILQNGLRQQLEDWLSRQREHCSLALMMNLRLLIEASDETHAALLQHMGRG